MHQLALQKAQVSNCVALPLFFPTGFSPGRQIAGHGPKKAPEGGKGRRLAHSPRPPNRNKQQDLSEKDGGSLLSVPRRCGQEKRMREEASHREQHSAATRTSSNTFPFRPPRARSQANLAKHGPRSPVVALSAPGFSWCLNGGFRLDVANTRNSNQGFRRGEIAQTSASGSHPPAHRSQRVARADHDDWDHEAVRFERHTPAQRLVEDTRAGYDPGLEFELPQTVRLKACAFHCAGRDLPT